MNSLVLGLLLPQERSSKAHHQPKEQEGPSVTTALTQRRLHEIWQGVLVFNDTRNQSHLTPRWSSAEEKGPVSRYLHQVICDYGNLAAVFSGLMGFRFFYM